MSSNRGLQLGLYLGAAFALRTISKAFETVGDAGVVPADRLVWHVTALVFLLGAAFCFIRALVVGFKMIRDGKSEPDLAKVFGDGEPPAIGPATRRHREIDGPDNGPIDPQPPSRPGFGRKGL